LEPPVAAEQFQQFVDVAMVVDGALI
jgi:hypothetical protein